MVYIVMKSPNNGVVNITFCGQFPNVGVFRSGYIQSLLRSVSFADTVILAVFGRSGFACHRAIGGLQGPSYETSTAASWNQTEMKGVEHFNEHNVQ